MEEFFIHPNAGQITLSTVVQAVASMIVIPYLSLALGGVIVAIIADLRGMTKSCAVRRSFAGNFVKSIANNFGVGFVLGVVPILAVAFSFSQFMYGADSPVVSYFLYAAFFNLVGFLFLGKYKEVFDIIGHVDDSEKNHHYLEEIGLAEIYSGFAAVAFLFLGAFFLIGGYAIALDPELWQHGFVVIFLSIQVWFKFIAFLCGSFAFAGVSVYFFFCVWTDTAKDISENLKNMATLVGGTLALIFTPLFTLFTALHLKWIPRTDYSFGVVFFAALAVITLFFVLHMAYYTIAHRHVVAGAMGFVLFVSAFVFCILADSFSLNNAVREHVAEITKTSGDSHDTHGDDGH
ncbi:MAG: hypothetical protein COA79_08135 [Planctomycetota bacterium]|nr:MAG: hypothetical protein COA79_08135 [Planctomycetota bacterium]